MVTYVAFLRGINLGPSNRVAMPELRALAEDLGYEGVATYLQSGNLVLTSAKQASTIQRELRAGLQERFGLTLDVIVRNGKQLQQVLAGNPFGDGDPSQVTVAFLGEIRPRMRRSALPRWRRSTSLSSSPGLRSTSTTALARPGAN